MSVAELERNYKELAEKFNTLEDRVDTLEERLDNGVNRIEKIDERYEAMRIDINDLKSELKASYQESFNQLMSFFNENQKNEFELRKNQQTFMYKIVGTLVGSGGVVWVIVDFLIKK